MGINSIFPRELEADDIVAYICREHEGSKVIISVDRDFLQLVSSECTLYDPIRKKFFEEREARQEKFFNDLTQQTIENYRDDRISSLFRDELKRLLILLILFLSFMLAVFLHQKLLDNEL